VGTIPQSESTPSQMISHRHMQRRFNKHRDKLDRHRAKGPMFAAAIDELEKQLFGEEPN